MSQQITVELPDGTSREYVSGTTPAEVAASIGTRLAQAAVAAKADGEWIDLARPLDHDVALQIVVPASDEGREVLRHSTAHVMAEAVTRLFPGAKVAIGPAIADGFYYDFDLPDGRTFSDDDLARIEDEMRAIVKADQRFERSELTYDDALALFADQPYKREIIEKVRSGAADAEDAGEAGGDGAAVSVYRNVVDGDVAFVDLCRGPHVPSTGKLGAFKLLKVAGAYWRGNEKGPMLQRIYGTAWESKAALAEHLHRLEEAERRDHRRLGVELDLFSFPEEIGSGLAVFHPKGALVRRIMEEYSRQRHEASDYQFVNSPHITKEGLFQTSGHLDWFADSMFPPMHLDEGGQDGAGTTYYLKPMNCPFHILIFKHRTRSYRELPQRFFEFGTVYRYEKSGVVHGLTRVRGLTQDDAHIFCTKEQMAGELSSLLDFVLDVLRDYGLDDFYLELSTKPPGKAAGTDEEWDEATEALRDAAQGKGLALVLDVGGGAFYGPKISVQAKDAIGRTWQMSTIQLDFQMPQRFDMQYVGADNERHRPVMIHRALFGSVERFFAVLVEHYAGAFPAWLAPVQVTVLPVSDRHDPYGFRIVDRLVAEGFRAEMVDGSSGQLGSRIRRAKTEKVPYILVVGDSDVDNGTVGVNARGSNDPERDVHVDAFVERLAAEVLEHR
ncbi:MAG: threonyl-tRNA synthetase [Actinomycetota bacterium]|jgi:threonyl-tRNA synthetase|nr:threonyl-tRNA synthetase [Actinomycetota bacterium]